MVTHSRFSTRTVVDSGHLVPWLAHEGPLAYSPAEPPASDYFFQYSWILPGIFDPQVNLRQHRCFGSPLKSSARFLFDFWSNARSGRGAELQRYCELRITTFFAGESEVKIVDPSRIREVQPFGCEVQFLPPMEP